MYIYNNVICVGYTGYSWNVLTISSHNRPLWVCYINCFTEPVHSVEIYLSFSLHFAVDHIAPVAELSANGKVSYCWCLPCSTTTDVCGVQVVLL